AVLDGTKDALDFGDIYGGDISPPSTVNYTSAYTPNDNAWSTDGSDLLTVNSQGTSYSYNKTILDSAFTHWTVEFKVRLRHAGTGDGDGDGFAVEVRKNGVGTGIVVEKDGVSHRAGSSTYTQIVSAYNVANADNDFNTFRMAYDGSTIYVWRDALDGSGWKLLADNLSPRSQTGGQLGFGDFTSGTYATLDADVDFVAFDLTGAWNPVPEPATLMVLVSGMAVCLLRKRR
ncbi:MAG: PEP-CTERM sorting domain-containing protein, partial [Actinobacteria bacterium]|nr:PEP-CTERM sorting domain-containing protein [Actinomycetota bacterium]